MSEIIESYNKIIKLILIGHVINTIWNCILVFLRGIGQIFLQSNSITGIFFLVGMFYGNAEMTYTMIICVIVASLTAKISKLPHQNIMDGLYGFNAALIGCAMIFYFHLNASVVIGYIVGSIASTFLMHLFLWTKMPAYTFPFIGITWVIKIILEKANLADSKLPGPTVDYRALDYIRVPSHAFGEVMFQGDAISGILMIVGIFISSPIGALYGVVGSVISVIYTQLYQPTAQISVIDAGLFSFNAVLSGIASSGDKVVDGFYMLITVGVATVFYIFLASKNFTTLTFPFVTSLWLLQFWKRFILGYLLPKIRDRYQLDRFFSHGKIYSKNRNEILKSSSSETYKNYETTKGIDESPDRIHSPIYNNVLPNNNSNIEIQIELVPMSTTIPLSSEHSPESNNYYSINNITI